MGTKRTRHLNLPTRMLARVRSSGTYYYYLSGKKELPLGGNYVEAMRKWAEYEGGNAAVAASTSVTFKHVSDLYLKSEKFASLAPRTREDYEADLKTLLKYFNDPPVAIDDIQSKHIALYRDWRKVTHSTQELALFSAIWKWAKERGYVDKENPAAGVARNRAKGRGIYIDDALFNKVYEKADQPTKDAMDLALLAGQRPADCLKMKETDVREGFLWVKQGKTGAMVRIEVIGQLKSVIDRIMARKQTLTWHRKGSKVRSLSLVVNERGQALTASALDGRFGKAREAAGVSPHDFQFRDLRAKAATEVEGSSGMEAAQGLLGHATSNMTRHYVRHKVGKMVKPSR